jgi:hypothetical protein
MEKAFRFTNLDSRRGWLAWEVEFGMLASPSPYTRPIPAFLVLSCIELHAPPVPIAIFLI